MEIGAMAAAVQLNRFVDKVVQFVSVQRAFDFLRRIHYRANKVAVKRSKLIDHIRLDRKRFRTNGWNRRGVFRRAGLGHRLAPSCQPFSEPSKERRFLEVESQQIEHHLVFWEPSQKFVGSFLKRFRKWGLSGELINLNLAAHMWDAKKIHVARQEWSSAL